MRQSLRYLLSLSSIVSVCGLASFASAQESPSNVQVEPAPAEPSPSSQGQDVTSPDYTQQPGENGTMTPGTTNGAMAQPGMTTPGMTTTPEGNTSFIVNDPNEPQIDTETTRMTFPNRPLLTTSSVLFVGSYVPTVIWQAAKDRNNNLYIPVAGPWMQYKQRDPSTGRKIGLAVDGIVQGLGALGIISSMFIPEKRTQNWYLIPMGRRAKMTLTPERLAVNSYGLLATGTF